MLGVLMDPLGKLYEVVEEDEFNLICRLIPTGKMRVARMLLKHGWVYERVFPVGSLWPDGVIR